MQAAGQGESGECSRLSVLSGVAEHAGFELR
jgi:hypothetical protein